MRCAGCWQPAMPIWRPWSAPRGKVAATALQALFPTLLATAAGAEIAVMLADVLAERAPETLILRAHPDTLATIAAETADERDAGRLIPEPAPDMAFGAAEAAWNGGGITFDPAALLARVTAVLTACGRASDNLTTAGPTTAELVPDAQPSKAIS